MPFLQFAISHIAVSHLLSGSGESSKIEPTLTENCLLHSRQRHSLRDSMYFESVALQRGQTGLPSGQRIAATNALHTSSSEKYLIASCKPFGNSLIVLMDVRILSTFGI